MMRTLTKDMLMIKNGDKYFNGYKYIYVDLIKDLIINDSYYKKLNKLINETDSAFKIYYVSKIEYARLILSNFVIYSLCTLFSNSFLSNL